MCLGLLRSVCLGLLRSVCLSLLRSVCLLCHIGSMHLCLQHADDSCLGLYLVVQLLHQGWWGTFDRWRLRWHLLRLHWRVLRVLWYHAGGVLCFEHCLGALWGVV